MQRMRRARRRSARSGTVATPSAAAVGRRSPGQRAACGRGRDCRRRRRGDRGGGSHGAAAEAAEAAAAGLVGGHGGHLAGPGDIACASLQDRRRAPPPCRPCGRRLLACHPRPRPLPPGVASTAMPCDAPQPLVAGAAAARPPYAAVSRHLRRRASSSGCWCRDTVVREASPAKSFRNWSERRSPPPPKHRRRPRRRHSPLDLRPRPRAAAARTRLVASSPPSPLNPPLPSSSRR